MGVAIVGPLAFCIGMVHKQAKTGSVTGSCPLQDLQVTIGVAKRRDWSSPNVAVDADGLANVVVDEVNFRETNKDRFAVAHFELRFDTAVDDLLRRDAVGLFGKQPQELNSAPEVINVLNSLARK